MTDRGAVLASRIHFPGCPWHWSQECEDDIRQHREDDEEAIELLLALARQAYRSGLEPVQNSNQTGARNPTHRCPVGGQVRHLPDHGFSTQNPMPWVGELYAESTDCQSLYRLYFIERRPEWEPPTTDIVGSKVGWKPVSEGTDWTSEDQTRDILAAMRSGSTFCRNTQHVWRRWDTT